MTVAHRSKHLRIDRRVLGSLFRDFIVLRATLLHCPGFAKDDSSPTHPLPFFHHLPSLSQYAKMDRASQALARGVPPGVRKSFRALADHSNVPRTTLQHREAGRKSMKEKAESQLYLRPWEEKAFVNWLKQQDELGQSVRIKYLSSMAFKLACRRPLPADRPTKPPCRNWTQLFSKRYAEELKPSKSAALDWKRYNIL